MFFKREKLQSRINELSGRRYIKVQSVAPFTSMEGQRPKDQHYCALPECIEGGTYDVNDIFVGYDAYLWLEKDVLFPQDKEGYELVGLFDFGKTGAGHNSGFESLLYVNGHPYQGVDSNHKEVVFKDLAGQNIKLTFLLWTGLDRDGRQIPFYHQCKQAELAYLNKKADELYYIGQAILGSLELIDKDSEYYEMLLRALDQALLIVDWDGEDFYETVEMAYNCLVTELKKIGKHTDVTVHAIGHTHIDVAWRWRLKHTREKVQRSFATVLHLMELYDDYYFIQSQPQLYKYIKEDCPEIYTKIQQKIRDGKWEAGGGMWIEADCNLSSGESLVRQMIHGTRFFEEEFGKKCEYLWLPDVFGYSWALPQILKLCEIDMFMTTKISWNEYNTMPSDLFKWRGIDGSEVLTYFIPTPGGKIEDRITTYGAQLTPYDVIGNWKKFKNKNLTKHTLHAYGFGDGGGGVTRRMLEMRRALDKLPGIPHVKTGTAGEFFNTIKADIQETDEYVHVWDGELYLELHRGTYTTQGYNKMMNRYLENKLTQVEWLSALTHVNGGNYEQDQLQKAWECVLLHQFHDIIPGSSIHDVYEDSKANYEKVDKQIEGVKERALSNLLQAKENTYSVYSVNSFAGKETVFIPTCQVGYFTYTDGTILESQKCEGGYEVLLDTNPFAFVTIIFVPQKTSRDVTDEKETFVYHPGALDTPYYRLQWNEDGYLTKIYDKVANRNVLREGQKGNVLEVFEDKPRAHDAWDIEIFHIEKMSSMKVKKEPELLEIGPLKAIVRFSYKYHNSEITQDMIVYAHSRRIDFKTHVDWQETHKLLKVAFYTDIRSTKATYDIQFGHVERPTHWNTSWDWARFEVCGHKWADLSETGYGVSLLNDSKYGYSIKDNAMKMSLLRSTKAPDHVADMGEHRFTYSLYPHQGSLVEGGTIEEANRLNLPAQLVAGVPSATRAIIKVFGDNVQVDAVKKAEDGAGLIVRLHECHGGQGQVLLRSEYPFRSIVPCNLLEHNMGDQVEGNAVEFTIKPFEIKTFKLEC